MPFKHKSRDLKMKSEIGWRTPGKISAVTSQHVSYEYMWLLVDAAQTLPIRLDNRLTDGCKFVSTRHRPLSTSRNIIFMLLVLISVRG
jgi:hypothetical protein